MNRSAVFLDEMGVGPLWHLRQETLQPVAEEIVMQAPVALAEPESEPEPVAEMAPPVVLAAPAPEPEPVAVIEDSSTAWFDDAPAP